MVPRDVTSAARCTQLTLDPQLATYLLCIVGHVLEECPQEEQDCIAVAAKAVAVYKLLRQVSVDMKRNYKIEDSTFLIYQSSVTIYSSVFAAKNGSGVVVYGCSSGGVDIGPVAASC